MIVTLNGYPLNDGSNNSWLNDEATGLELPTIRTSSGNYAGRDGGFVGAQFFSARDITFQGTLFSKNIALLETARSGLQAALISQRSANLIPVTITIVTNAGNSYVVYANLLDFKMPINKALFKATFKIELLATDPTIYLQESFSVPGNLPLVVSGGVPFPVTFPVDFPAGSLPVTIVNTGTVAVYPIITLTGIMTNPVLTNLTTEQTFGMELTTSPGDVLVLNFQQRTALLNGSSVFGDVTSASWWQLIPGDNSIALTSSSGSDTVTGTIQWQSGVMGI
jgi:hypothetical protein